MKTYIVKGAIKYKGTSGRICESYASIELSADDIEDAKQKFIDQAFNDGADTIKAIPTRVFELVWI